MAQFPLRTAIADHLQCWARHSRFPVIYHNFAFGFDWKKYSRIPLSGVILDTLALNIRWSPDFFRARTAPLRALRQFNGPKIALPQDEFVHTTVLCEFLAEIGITDVLSAASPDTAEAIYRAALPHVRLGRKLTGYLEGETLQRIDRLAEEIDKRDIDLSYRAWHAEAWLGQHGRLKIQIAQEAMAISANYPQLRFDISTQDGDALTGDDWYRFLLRSRATLGVEGGASVLDRDGAIAERTRAYVMANPSADFESIRQNCFASEDGKLSLFAIGPRHLEACATRTCQLLVEGEYQGILRTDLDYISIRKDFSNLRQVLDRIVNKDPAIAAVVASAYARVVASGNYSYQTFVRHVEDEILLKNRLSWVARLTAARTMRLVSEAAERHARIAEFAITEAREYLPFRHDYETSEEPHWRRVRAGAQKLRLDTGLILNPNWPSPPEENR